jgi:ribulose-phosphate 3-epimerase
MASGRMQVTASILDCDLANLASQGRLALRSGADRLHLDVMDGHFVPNITFGHTVIKRLRPIGKQPFDAHLMISEPGRYMDNYIDAGCDTISFHVEVEEPIEPILLRIRKAGRRAGLAIKPATPLSVLEPYRDLLDIVMIMTVEPGFGGQKFMFDAAQKIGPAHGYLADPASGQVHVDGGVNRGTVEVCGGLAAEVVVAGSILWKPGVDIVHEIRLVKALGDKGYAMGPGAGKAPIAHGDWVVFATLPSAAARALAGRMEAAGIPSVTIGADRARIGARSDRGRRLLEILVPADDEPEARRRFGEDAAAATGATAVAVGQAR